MPNPFDPRTTRGTSTAVRLDQSLPDLQPSFLETLLSPLSVLDRPGNVVRSLLVGDPLNALQSAVPFVDYRRVGAKEITGFDSGLANFVVELGLDPLTYVGGIGAATKAGKLLSKAGLLADEIKILKSAGKVKAASQTQKLLDTTLKQITKEGVTTADRTRSLIKLDIPFASKVGSIEIGDLTKLTGQISELLPATLLANPRIAAYQSELTKVTKNILTKSRTKAGVSKKLQDQHDNLITSLSRAREKPSILSESLSNDVRSTLNTLRKRFSTKKDFATTQMLEDIMKGETARDVDNLGRAGALIVKQIDDLAKLAKAGTREVREEFNKRFVRGGEARFIVEESADTITRQRVKAIQKDARGKLKKTSDAFEQQKITDKLKADLIAEQKNAYVRAGRYSEAADRWGALTVEEQRFWEQWGLDAQEMLTREKGTGIFIEDLRKRTDYLSFVPRIVTKEALKLKRTNKELYRIGMNDAKVMMDSARRRKLFPEEDIVKINELMRDVWGLKFDFFDTDVANILLNRKIQHVTNVNRAMFAQHALRAFGTTAKEGTISASKLFTELRLKPKGIKITPFAGGADIAVNSLRIPKEIFKDIVRTDELLKQGDELTGRIIHAMDTVTNAFRVGLTAFFPAKIHRDFVSNMSYAMVGDGFSLKKLHEAGGFLNKVAQKGVEGLSDAERIRWDRYVEQRLIRTLGRDEITDFSKTLGKPSGKFEEFSHRPTSFIVDKFRKVAGMKVPQRTRDQYDKLWGRGYNRFIDETSKIMMFEARLAKGDSIIAAGQRTRKYIFDMADITPFERAKIKPWFLFYTFTRKNLPMVAGLAITRPRILSTYQHITGLDRNVDMPDWLRTGFAFKDPTALLGDRTYIGKIGLPFEDVNILNTASADPDIFSQTERLGQRVFTQANPIIRSLFELVTGKTAFTGRKLRDQSKVDLLKRALPTTRFTGTLDKLFDSESPGAFVLDFLTGLKTYDVDPIQAKRDTLRKRLLQTGRVKRLGDSFILSPKREFKEDQLTLDQLSAFRKVK